MDETTEHLLYQTIKERLPEMIILSVGHRSTLQQFHNKQLKLDVCLLCENQKTICQEYIGQMFYLFSCCLDNIHKIKTKRYKKALEIRGLDLLLS